MAERRGGTKSRRLGSSRRRQLREGSAEVPATAPGPSEEPSWTPKTEQEVQGSFREQGEDQARVVANMQTLQEGFQSSTEGLELGFDGLDAAGTEERSAVFGQFLSSQRAARDPRRRKTASRRVRLVLPSPAPEGVESEEQRHFAAFMDQLGTDKGSEEQEIWQLWLKLRQDEPQLLGNLEGFLAKMRQRIQEAKSKKEALEVTLNKHLADHDREVQQLCDALEQQIQQEQQLLEQQSTARSHQHRAELQQALDASEREVQRLVTVQVELEERCRRLHSTQQAASTENQQLKESNQELEDRLQHLHQQLQQTQGRLQTARATVAWERVEEPGDRVVAELPGEMPVSPQMSPEKSETYRSEMRIRLGSQSRESRAKITPHVVWETLPTEVSRGAAPPEESSAQEDPSPGFPRAARFSDQSSLLREMSDAIAALSQHLKTQASGTAPQDDAEPHTGPEAAPAHGTTPKETLAGHRMLEGDLREGAAAAELDAPDMTQAGASAGLGCWRAQEPGAGQGETPEEPWRRLFLQGMGAVGKELNGTEQLQGESREAGGPVLMEVEGGCMEAKPGWEGEQPPGKAEGVGARQGENLEVGLGPSKTREAGLAARRPLAMDEATELLLGLSEKLEIKPGERLGEEELGATQGDDVLDEVMVTPAPGMLEVEGVGVEMQPWAETPAATVLLAPAQCGGSSDAGAEGVPCPREAEPWGGSVRGDGSVWGQSTEVLLLEALAPAEGQEDRVGAQGGDAKVQLFTEVEGGFLGTEQGGSGDPDVQLQQEDDKAGTGLGEMGAAAVHSEGASLAETPVRSADLTGLLPVKAQAVELVEAEDSQGHMELCGGPSLETPQGREDHAVIWFEEEEAEGESQGEDEHGLTPREEAVLLDLVKDQSPDATVQLLTEEEEELNVTSVGSTETDLQPLSEFSSLGTEQGWHMAPDVQPLDQAGKAELEEPKAEDAQADAQLWGDLSTKTILGQECGAAVHVEEEGEDRSQGQDEHGLPQEHVLGLQGEEPGAGVTPQKAVILDMAKDQSPDATVQPLTGAEELKLSPVGSTEADLQPPSEFSSLDTGQGGSGAPGVQPLDQTGKSEPVELEAEDAQADAQLIRGPSLETSKGEEDHAVIHFEEETEDGGQGEDEHGLPHETLLDLQGAGTEQREEPGARVQPWEEAVVPDTLENQSPSATMQPLRKKKELELSPVRSTEADLQPLSVFSSWGAEQGWSGAADVQPLDQVGKSELVELEAEDAQAGAQLYQGPGLQPPQFGEDHAVIHFEEEEDAEDWREGQDERELPHEPVLDLQEAGSGQVEGPGAVVTPQEESVLLDLVKDQSLDATVQPLTEVEELSLTPGGSTEADLLPLSEFSCLQIGQRGNGTPEVQPLAQFDEGELTELETEDGLADTQLCGDLSTETLLGQECGAVVQVREEDEDQTRGEDEHELPQELVLDLQRAGAGQGEGPGAGVTPQEEAVILDLVKDDSPGAIVQPLTEVEELRLSPGGSTEADLLLLSEFSNLRTEQGWSGSPDVQPLDQAGKPKLEKLEAEDAQSDTQLCGGSSPETILGQEGRTVIQLMEEAEGPGHDEHGVSHSPQGAGAGLGEEPGVGVTPWEEAVTLGVMDNQSPAANVQPLTEVEMLKPPSGGHPEADVAALAAVGMLQGEQSQTPGLEVGLDVADTADLWEGAAGALVSPPAETTLHAECAAEDLGLEAKLGAPTGADVQILEDTQLLEPLQGERAAAERPLDGAEGLEVVQGRRLEAELRGFVETLSPGTKQGHGDEVPELVPTVTLQTSRLELEQLMQEGVLVPDALRLGASGQAAPSKRQEQVSAQADKGRLLTAFQQREEKEQVAAGPAQPPKQEMPPAAILQVRVQQEEDAGNDQLRLVHGDSSLGGAASSNVQPQRQLLGGQSKDLSVGQQEKQEVGVKMSQEGSPSPEKPETVTADGARAAPRGSPEASQDLDHLYNILFVGDSHVGKTSFLHRLHADTFNPHLTATVGLDYQVKSLIVDNKHFVLRLWDSAGQERYHSITKQFFRKADGVVLMYDVTSESSFSDVRYWLSCIQEGAEDGVSVLLLGNKTDCAAERRVPTQEGERLAKEHQLIFFECSAASGHNVSKSIISLVRLLKVREDELKIMAREMPPPPQKKKGCCW